MTHEQRRPTVQEALSRRMRELRTESGRTQDDVAAAARLYGLEWRQTTVAAYEQGRRAFTLDIVLLLPLIYSRVLKREFALTELFTEPVQLTPTLPLSPQSVARALTGPWSPSPIVMLDPDKAIREAERRAARRLGVTPDDLLAAAVHLWGRNLTEEREERLMNLELEGELPDHSVRANRKGMTEVLLRELAPAVEAINRQKDQDHEDGEE